MKLGRRSRWLAGLALFLLSILESKGQEEEVVIVPTGSDGWSYLDPVTGDNEGFDPALFDFDFDSTWFDPLGVYLGGEPYDGPAFTEGASAPFTREALAGFPQGGTILGLPEPETLGSFYLLKTIDGGDGGYRDLTFSFWAYDGCYIYLNGELAAVGNMDPDVPDTWSAPALLASPQFFYTPALPTRQVWLEPGPNLLAISVHNANPSDPRSGISLQITGTPGPPHPVKITRGPYLQKTTSETITVCWRTSHHANSKVSYGRASDLKWTVLSDPGFVLDREVTITGLLPDTSYYYSVESEDVRGTKVGAGGDEKGHWFRTAPSPGESKPTRIWVIGDSGTGLRLGGGVRDQRSRSVFEGFLDYTEDEPPDLWLMLGDNAYGSGTDQQYQEAVFETYAEIIGNTPIWPALGNHDSFNTPVYKSIFSLPTGGEAGGMPSGSELYYSFDHADIHFICLNSATRTSANPDISTVMYEWLEADLASTDQEWIIAYFHHGPYTKGSHDSDREVRHRWLRENAIPLLEDYGVDLILSGHSHAYERSMLIDGHYGRSENFDPTRMLIDGGNGSDVGSVSETGEFLEGLGMTGAYQKPAATGNAGAVYSTVGSSGRISRWTNGSNDLVNPEPHAVMLVNLLTLGSMVIEIDGVRLNAKFLDVEGEVRDDFTILKGSTVSLESTDPVFVETGSDETATFRFSRKGAVDIPLEVEFSLSGTADLTVDYVTPDPIGGLLTFAAGESEREITLRRVHDLVPEGRETVNLALRESRTYRSAENKRAVTAYLLEDPYEGWTMANFGVVNLGLGREPGDNPDGDQWSNLLEYALGGHPLIPDSGAGLIVRALGPFLVLEYPRDVTKPHLVYTVEASTNLVDWTTAPVTDSLVEPAGENGVELRRGLVFDKGEELPFRFLRLRVELAN